MIPNGWDNLDIKLDRIFLRVGFRFAQLGYLILNESHGDQPSSIQALKGVRDDCGLLRHGRLLCSNSWQPELFALRLWAVSDAAGTGRALPTVPPLGQFHLDGYQNVNQICIGIRCRLIGQIQLDLYPKRNKNETNRNTNSEKTFMESIGPNASDLIKSAKKVTSELDTLIQKS